MGKVDCREKERSPYSHGGVGGDDIIFFRGVVQGELALYMSLV
jgi:hypothetical protein